MTPQIAPEVALRLIHNRVQRLQNSPMVSGSARLALAMIAEDLEDVVEQVETTEVRA